MRDRLSRLHLAVLHTLILIPLPMSILQYFAEDYRPALMLGLIAGGCAFVLCLVPGRIGQNERKFPLRLTLSLVCAVGLIGLAAFAPLALMLPLAPVARWVLGLLFGLSIPVIVRLDAREEALGDGIKLLAAGVAVYLVCGIMQWGMNVPGLSRAVYLLAISFFIIAAFSLNHGSLLVGYSTHRHVRPQAALKRANRWMVVALILIAAFVAGFDSIRQWATEAVRAVVRAVVTFLLWLSSLGQSDEIAGPIESGGGMDLSGMDASEPALIWEILYRVLLVVALAVAAYLVYRGLKILWRKLRQLIRFLKEYFKRFAETAGEDYQDERVSLFDGDELMKNLQDTLRRGLDRFKREKRWEDMDPRERVRSVVRSVYRRGAREGLAVKTLRESAEDLNFGQADREQVIELYERARYADPETHPIDPAEAESLRRTVRS